MSQTSRQTQEKMIAVPKHLLKYRDEVSPYGKSNKLKNVLGTRILVKARKNKSARTRGQTLSDKTSDDEMINLITVERNYVRELINSPIKLVSRSPLLPRKIKNLSPNKSKIGKSAFESLTACDFIAPTNKKKSREPCRPKFSLTPDLPGKRKCK